MATLDRRGILAQGRGDLLLNFSSAAPVSNVAQQRIGEALDHARAILADVAARLQNVAAFSAQQQAAYLYHIKVAHDGDPGALARVDRNLGLAAQALNGNVTLSDARAAEISSFCEEHRRDIESWSGQAYQSNADMIASLFADNGWGVTTWTASAGKLYFQKKLRNWTLGRKLTPIGPAAGYVRITSQAMDIYTRTRSRPYEYINKPHYDWQFGETLNMKRDYPKANPPQQDVPDVTKANSIHLDFSMFDSTFHPISTLLYRACVLIHEATHKAAFTADFAYTGEGGYDQLTVAQSVNNADSLAYLAISLYSDRVFLTHKDI